MAKCGQKPSLEAWQTHILHVANLYANRSYSAWHFEYYPQEANRIYED